MVNVVISVCVCAYIYIYMYVCIYIYMYIYMRVQRNIVTHGCVIVRVCKVGTFYEKCDI